MYIRGMLPLSQSKAAAVANRTPLGSPPPTKTDRRGAHDYVKRKLTRGPNSVHPHSCSRRCGAWVGLLSPSPVTYQVLSQASTFNAARASQTRTRCGPNTATHPVTRLARAATAYGVGSIFQLQSPAASV